MSASLSDSAKVNQLFDERLKPRLEVLESVREKVMVPFWIALACLVGAIALANALGAYNIPSTIRQGSQIATGITIFVSLLVLAIGGGLASKKYKVYRRQFKDQVVAEILKLYNPQWVYLYDQCIAPDVYHASEIFRHQVDRYSGDDLVKGKIGGTDFACSELHTQYKTVTYDSKGRRQEQWHTIFRGLFFHADFNKHIKGKTFVLPDSVESFLGKFGQTLQAMNKGRGELVKMEDPVFEKKFMVFGQDQIEPRTILTPNIMQNLTRLQEKTKRHIRLAFIGSRVYVAVSFAKALFEPRLFNSGVRLEDVQEIFDLFGLMESIVEEMDLNTRIWSKS